MAVQYDSKNDSWSTWLDIFKNKIPSASEEAVSAFEKIQEQVGQGIDLYNYDNFSTIFKTFDSREVNTSYKKELPFGIVLLGNGVGLI